MQSYRSKYNAEQLLDYLSARQTERGLPFGVTFELTPLCNFRCKMCYIRLDSDQLSISGDILSTEEWLCLARQARDAGVYKVTFTGGEVFSRPDFQIIYETMYNMGFHISIISNGYLIDEHVSEWLSRRKPDFIKITLYGAKDETYKRVCGVNDGFSIVTSNIHRLRAKGISVVTCMTVIEDNSDDVEMVRKWASDQKIKFIYSKVIRKKTGNARTAPEEVRLAIDNKNSDRAYEVRHLADLFPKGNNTPFENCAAYRNSCIIGWNGIVKGCNFINTITSDLKGRKLVDSYRELWDRLDSIKRPEKCINCKYLRFCNPCPGKLEGESGNPEELSEYVCELAKWCYYNVNIDKTNSSSNEALDTLECE